MMAIVNMEARTMVAVLMLSLLSSSVMSQQQSDFDFFYFVQQWPGSYCDTRRSCCYPKSGKPTSDFSIHGLWPNYNDGTYPSNCDTNNPFAPSKISDLEDEMEKEWPSLACPSSDNYDFWSHEWTKHGTCSESVFDQHQYFQAALKLKDQFDILSVLKNAGIQPDGNTYSLDSIKSAIQTGTGNAPFIECNVDGGGQPQLYQVYMCVDKSGANFTGCPVSQRGRCADEVEFPTF